MREHATLRTPGRARAVRDDTQIVRSHAQLARLSIRRERITPQRHALLADRLTCCAHDLGHSQLRRRADAVAVGGDDRAIDFRTEQRLDLRINLLSDQRYFRSAVLHVVLELGGDAHRVHRYDDRVGAQDRVVRNDELRAVLHHQQDSIALLHSAVVLQVSRELLGLLRELRVRQHALEKNHERLIWIARCGNRCVVEQVGRRHAKIVRQGFGPELEILTGHDSAAPPRLTRWVRRPAWMDREIPQCGRLFCR